MKILLTSTGSWGTGSFTVINALIDEFSAMGHQVKVFLPDDGTPSAESEYYYNNPEIYKIWKFPIEKGGIKLDNFPLMISDPNPRNESGITFRDLSIEQFNLYQSEFKTQIKKVIDEFQPDIIECQHIWLMAHVIHELGVPYCVTAHNSDQMGYEFDARMQPFADSAAVNAKYVFTISEYVHKEVLEIYDMPAEKVIMLPNGYDKKVFCKKQVDRAEFLAGLGVNIPTDADIITFAGKLSRTKGIDTVLAANCLLNDPKIHMLMFGAGDIEDIVDDCIHEHALERLHFVGHQPPEIVAQAHNIAKISIMPSRSEGFGIAGLEAMGCSLPLIATENTGAESFAVGKIIASEEPEQLANAILELLNLSDVEYQSLADKALEMAQKYSWDVVAKKRLEYFAN